MSRSPDNDAAKDRSELPRDLLRGQVENAKNLEKDIFTPDEDEPVQQHLERPRRRPRSQLKQPPE